MSDGNTKTLILAEKHIFSRILRMKSVKYTVEKKCINHVILLGVKALSQPYYRKP